MLTKFGISLVITMVTHEQKVTQEDDYPLSKGTVISHLCCQMQKHNSETW